MTIAIIGAGMAGLSAARELSLHLPVVIFDKSRGVGGRMSTRYAGEYEFDHGAQYFTVTDPDFLSQTETMEALGEVARWDCRAFYLKDGALMNDEGKPRWVGAPRMNSVPKWLAGDLDIRLGRRVKTITGKPGEVFLVFEDDSREGPFEHVICTVPAPQAADILPSSSELQPVLGAVEMHACFALMVGLNEAFDPGFDTLRTNNLPVSWMALNNAKPGRGEVSTLVVHGAPDWSDAHADADREWVQSVLLDCASILTARDLSSAPHLALHRWLYAYADEGVGKDYLQDDKLGVTLAGDWCVGGRVEGAVISGRAAAAALLKS